MGAVRQRRTVTIATTTGAVEPDDSPRASTWSVEEIVQEHGEYWTVHDLETGIFGSGDDLAAAMEDFQAALREHLDVLSRQDDLSPELFAQLGYLRDRLA